MLNLLFVLILIASLMNGFLLGGSLLWSILAVVLVIGFLAGMDTVQAGYLSYDEAVVEATKHLDQSEFIQSAQLLDELEKGYGASDTLLLLKARAAIGLKDYSLTNQYDKVQKVFMEAAQNHPGWSQAQLVAGAQSAINKNYAQAEYFLRRAYEQTMDDPIPLY